MLLLLLASPPPGRRLLVSAAARPVETTDRARPITVAVPSAAIRVVTREEAG